MEKLVKLYNDQVSLSGTIYSKRNWQQNWLCGVLLFQVLLLVVMAGFYESWKLTVSSAISFCFFFVMNHWFCARTERKLYPDYLTKGNIWDRKRFFRDKIAFLVAQVKLEYPDNHKRKQLAFRLEREVKKARLRDSKRIAVVGSILLILFGALVTWHMDQLKSVTSVYVMLFAFFLFAVAILLLFRELLFVRDNVLSNINSLEELAKLVRSTID